MNDFSHIDMNNEKVIKIIRASFEIFALNDFEKASTNMIVKKAGVSRGILYHYFKDKQELFEFLIYYSVQRSIKDIEDMLDWDNSDIISRICNTTKIKLKIIKEVPYLLEFCGKYEHLLNKYTEEKDAGELKENFYNRGIDYSKFRNQDSVKEAVHIIKWTYKGMCVDLLKRKNDLEEDIDISEILEECDKYYQVLIINFYNQ